MGLAPGARDLHRLPRRRDAGPPVERRQGDGVAQTAGGDGRADLFRSGHAFAFVQ